MFFVQLFFPFFKKTKISCSYFNICHLPPNLPPSSIRKNPLLPPFSNMLLSKVFDNMNLESKSLLITLKSRATTLSKQIETLEDNRATETDSKKKEILWKKVTEYEQNLIEVQREIEKHNDNSLNLLLSILCLP